MVDIITGVMLYASVIFNGFGDGEIVQRRFKSMEWCQAAIGEIMRQYPQSNATCEPERGRLKVLLPDAQ